MQRQSAGRDPRGGRRVCCRAVSIDAPATAEVLRFRAGLVSLVSQFLLALGAGACSVWLWNHDTLHHGHRDYAVLIPCVVITLFTTPLFVYYALKPMYEVSASRFLENVPFLPARILDWGSIAWYSVPPGRTKLLFSIGSGKVERFDLMPLSRRTRDRMIAAIDLHMRRSRPGREP